MKKNILTTLVLAMAMCMALPSAAQVKFGVKGGLNVSQIDLKGNILKSTLAKDNQQGFFAGVTVDANIPVIGLGADIAVLYDNKKVELDTETKTVEYIDLPLNVKYTLGLGSIASVYVATGPQFSWNISGKKWALPENQETISGGIKDITTETKSEFQLKKSEFSWNVGAGVTLLKHLRVGYNYNIAIGNTASVNQTIKTLRDDLTWSKPEETSGELKNNTHQISLTYFF